MQSPSGWRIVNLDLPVSNIGVPVTSQSTKSNFFHGDKRIVFENAANMSQYHTWFVILSVKPAENDTLLEGNWVKAATKLGWRKIEIRKTAMIFLSHLINK